MVVSEALQIPPRWGPLHPQRWPQDESRVPSTPGLQMPPVAPANAERSLRESFTLSGSIVVPFGNALGSQHTLYLETEPDGDFWCDQIFMAAWYTSIPIMHRGGPATVAIGDARTGRRLTYPDAIPTNFLMSWQAFPDDPGFFFDDVPLPFGFRSTSTISQPFCFTRAGGIQVTLTMLCATVGPDNTTFDIAFGGWKEYANAST